MKANLYDFIIDLQNELDRAISAMEDEIKAAQEDGFDSSSLEDILCILQEIYKSVS